MSRDRTRLRSSWTGDRLAAATLLVLAALIPFVTRVPWTDTPDSLFHIQRTRALAEALQAGAFYPRLFPDFAFGYGHAILNYYAPLSYYPAAGLHWLGFSLEPATLWGIALFAAVSMLAMYAFLRCWTGVGIALAGALLYMMWPYRLYDLFIRGALPEYAAFAWFPVIGLGTVKLYRRSADSAWGQGRAGAKYLALAAVGWCCLALTHNLSALLALVSFGLLLPFLFVYGGDSDDDDRDCIPSSSAAAAHAIDWRQRVRRLLAISAPLVLGAGLAAFYVLPALLELDWVILGHFENRTGYDAHFAALSTLFSWSFPYAYPQASEPTAPLPPYVLAVMLLLLPLSLDRGARGMRAAAIGCLILSASSLLLTTTLSQPVWEASGPVLSKLQFPWRWQAVLGFSTVWGTALLLQCVRNRFRQRSAPWHGALLGIVLAATIVYSMWGLPHSTGTLPERMLTREAMWEFDAANGQAGTTWLGEFMPVWVDEQRWAISRAPTDTQTDNAAPVREGGHGAAEAGAAQLTPLGETYLGGTFHAEMSRPTRLVFHTFYLPAWQVSIDGRPVQTLAASNLGLLAVDVPEGQHVVTLAWAVTPAARAGWIISGVAWIAMLIVLIAVDRNRRVWVATWLLLGLITAGLWLWPQQEIQPAAIGADFGEVRLESAHTAPVRAGTAAEVELAWLLVNPEQPLTSFIHLLGPDGSVVTQHDGPLAGIHTPFERWTPGMFVTRQHMLPIPSELAPGTYELMAGVYRSADSSDVMLPLSVDGQPSDGVSHRVSIGTIDVLP